jgi:serine/threonine-protein kinase
MFRPDSDADAPAPARAADRAAETKPETQHAWAVGSANALGVQETLVASSAPASDPIGQRVGSYRIVRALGKGGCGSVWLAEHEVIKSKVAIKILRADVARLPGVQERFVTEARAASTIPSPHVARYTDLGQMPTGEPYAIMEYLEGETVHGRIQHVGQLPLADALAITRQAAETLALAHDASIIHRDIKPENIFLVTTSSGGPNIKVLDFGIAKLVGDAMQSSAVQTASGAFVGTPAYCAPEQLLGVTTTAAVDMYALGTTLYEMLAGKLPYDISSPEFLVTKVSDPPLRVRDARPEIPERLDALVAAMLDANPRARPASMRVLLDALANLDAPAPTPVRSASARRWPLAVGAAVLVAATSVAAVLVSRGGSDEPTRPAIPTPTALPVRSQPTAPPPPPEAVPVQAAEGSATPVAPAASEETRTTTRPASTRTRKRPVETPASAESAGKPDVILADPFD